MKQVTKTIPLPNEISISYERPFSHTLNVIKDSNDVVQWIKREFPKTQLDYKEYFWCFFLTRANAVLGASLISTGNDSATLMSSKEVTQLALLSHASAVILIHNHPSGKLKFSEADFMTTMKIKKALDLFDIFLLDHLLIAREGAISMADTHGI